MFLNGIVNWICQFNNIFMFFSLFIGSEAMTAVARVTKDPSDAAEFLIYGDFSNLEVCMHCNFYRRIDNTRYWIIKYEV